MHENVLLLLQAQLAQCVVEFEQRLQQERLEARYKTQVKSDVSNMAEVVGLIKTITDASASLLLYALFILVTT